MQNFRFVLFSFFLTFAFVHTASTEEQAGQVVNVSGRVLVRNEDQSKPDLKILKAGDTISQGTVLNTSSVGNAKLLMTDKTVLDLGPSTLFKVKEYQHKKGEDQNRKVEMSMGYGKIRASVNSPVGPRGKFTIKTRTATMGVRGTEFVISTDLGVTPKPAQQAAPGGQASHSGTMPAGSEKTAKAAYTEGQTQITVIKGKVEVETTPVKGEVKKAEPIRLTEGTQLTTAAIAPAKDEAGRAITQVVEAPKIVKLSTDELKVVQLEAKQEDRTFVQAVSVDTSQDKGSGLATLQAISTSFTMPTDYVPTVQSMGLPGTFGPDMGLHDRINDRVIGAPVSIKVRFIK